MKMKRKGKRKGKGKRKRGKERKTIMLVNFTILLPDFKSILWMPLKAKNRGFIALSGSLLLFP